MANALNALRALIESPLMVGEVMAIAAGEARMSTPDGALHKARGLASVGDNVFFRPGGAIEGVAPSVSFDDIDV